MNSPKRKELDNEIIGYEVKMSLFLLEYNQLSERFLQIWQEDKLKRLKGTVDSELDKCQSTILNLERVICVAVNIAIAMCNNIAPHVVSYNQ